MTNPTPYIPMDEAHLERYAANAARGLTMDGTCKAHRMAAAVRADLGEVAKARRELEEWAAGRGRIPASVEWILDNHYLAVREGQEAVSALRRGGKIRRCEGGEALLQLCAKAAVWAVPNLQRQRMEIFLHGFQSVVPLTERELSLLVPCLARALLRQLAAICKQQDELLKDGEYQHRLEQLFAGLRALKAVDWSSLLEEASQLEYLMGQDPSGDYLNMEEGSRRRYRQRLCSLARQLGQSEEETARRVLELAQRSEGVRRHIGWYLFQEPLGRQKTDRSGRGYGFLMLSLSVGISLLVAAAVGFLPAALLLIFPVSDLVKNCVDFLAVHLVSPRPIHRMELKDGIPAEGRTLCVIVSLLAGKESGRELAALLERYRLANRDSGKELVFGILADLPDSSKPMDRERRDWVNSARTAIEELNKMYGGGYYLFFRNPAFQPQDELYQGWERKRGALLELTALLKGQRTGMRVLAGDQEVLSGVRYVITLDGDTCLSVGAAREMVGAMMHPLNRPRLDEKRRVVTEGYGLLQPRISVELTAANRTLFSRIYAGQGGVDPYGSTASDVYHDLFDQGTYTGKGIFDVDAYDACLSGRFPDNTILSHDLLEGGYLHAGFLGEVELTDDFPASVSVYFSRLHRWVRGDWQALPWLFRSVPAGLGGREANPLSPLGRWKVFDNLRRALSPVFTLLALVLGICVADQVFALVCVAAVLAAASNLLLSGAELAARGRGSIHVRYHSTIVAGLAGTILQTLIQIIFLPFQAYICAGAACTALWRMRVTKRGLLAWVTAAQSGGKKGTIFAYYCKEWFSPAVGLVTMLGAQLRFGILVGFIWVLAPAIAWSVSRPVKQKGGLAETDCTFLLHQAGLIWGYFEDFLREEDHYLPPDNWQEQPSVGLARRTSPTNIGMGLLSVMAAEDLELISRERAAEIISHMLDTLESLPKWRGHPYNWYATDTKQPLVPRYVSTVDSGNLCGSLIALREGLYEWGEDILARRAERLANAIEFASLYDPVRKLFSIGYEVEKERLTEGWYDLMASEARQTSYIAIARGEVEPRHWRRLGRMLLGDNDYRGMASWTGTMFEYFMPNLLMSCEENSFLYESLAFCIYAQKRRGARMKAPWGVSESAFYAFDAAMNYQYKAHGVQSLGLRRGLDKEYVLAPYATFLALLLAPKSGVRNLRRLRGLGLEGRYGLYEAVDFTPARLTGGDGYEVTRSYMSHHLGMSLVAIDNVLRENVMQRRFMRDCSMSAYRQLLQERVPVGAPVMRHTSREIPEKPARDGVASLLRRGEGYARLAPQCHLLGSGNYTILVSDNGLTQSKLGKSSLTLARAGDAYAPSGVGIFFAARGETAGLTAAPLYQEGAAYRWEFSAGEAVWHMERGELSSQIRLTVPHRENGEHRAVTLTWRGTSALEGELLFYLEPVLFRSLDYDAHPVFSKLFLESRTIPNGVLFHRRSREKEENPALAVLWNGRGAHFTTSREKALGRGGLRALPGRKLDGLSGQTGGHPDPCLLVAIPVRLEPGGSAEYSLILGASDSDGEAEDTARRILEGRMEENRSLTLLTQRLKLEQRHVYEGFRLLSALEKIPSEQPDLPPQAELWPFGISGDVPIVLGVVHREALEEARLWCAWQQMLCLSGYPFDLVLMMEETGDYRRPVRTALSDMLKELGAESALGAKGGIHLVKQGEEAEVIARWAKARLPLEDGAPEQAPPPPAPVRIEVEPASWEYDEKNHVVLHTGKALPPLGWSQILCNEMFGWVTDETGNGYFWQENAREGRLTPWRNDPLAVGGWERLAVQDGERWYSLFADGDELECTVTYGFGFAQWEKRLKSGQTVTTTAFVPHNEPCRVLLVEGVEKTLLSHTMGHEAAQTFSLDRQFRLVLVTECNGRKTGTHAVQGHSTFSEYQKRLSQTEDFWQKRVGQMEIETPDQALNHYLNGWALYQTLACRVFARTSQYQNGGAYGFRDQMQDVCALLYTSPEYAKRQIELACTQQFEEGDVQHWWHPPQGNGVRTRISDDLLWLPYVLGQYLEVTGDWAFCHRELPFLKARPLGAEEHERYAAAKRSEQTASVYDHACRAIDCVLRRGVGEHGLVLMGGGDWNDGMNRVGIGGRGESVWLTWFAALVFDGFSRVCETLGEGEKKTQLLLLAREYRDAAQNAWDGAWYRRGYYDDGTPLGAQGASQCAIDSIAQSFSAFGGDVDVQRANQAVSSAIERLFDREHGLVKLFAPPFSGHGKNPGYIRGYLPGVRENGGQYTHGAVWLALACFRLGRGDEGMELLHALLPQTHPVERYRAEPYVLAADVYAAAGYEGRGGWSWYTGASGWYCRTVMEALLGLSLKEGKLTLHPVLPRDWSGYHMTWHRPMGTLDISVRRGEDKGLFLDGALVSGGVTLSALEGERRLELIF